MRFRTKPVEIEAQLFDGSNESAAAILYWIGQSESALAAAEGGDRLAFVNGMGALFIRTLESGDGYHIASPGDMIIKGLKGEFYPCKPEIFAMKYEQVSASDAVPTAVFPRETDLLRQLDEAKARLLRVQGAIKEAMNTLAWAATESGS